MLKLLSYILINKLYILFFLILCFQLKAQNQDSISKPQTFENIESYSKKNKFTKSIHKLIFKNKTKQSNVQAVTAKEIDNDYHLYQGKIIRNIHIETMDPFGYSISDSTKKPVKKTELIGNKLNLKTKNFTIKNLLLFKKHDLLDSLKLKETERIIRTQRYVRRVRVTPIPILNSPDSVDVAIKVLDAWSIYPTGSASTSGARLRLVSRNFAGLGHYFSNQYRTRFGENKHGYQSQYQINNIANTFANVGALYDLDLDDNYQKSVYINRPFYSPLAKLAGGINLTKRFYKDSIPDLTNKNKNTNIKYNSYDFWVGNSIRLFEKENQDKVITNFVTSLRYNLVDYKETPLPIFDPEGLYTDQEMILGSIGISSLNFVQDKYLFNYGIIEDVSVGKVFSITGGLQWKNGVRRPYIGTKLSMGKYTNAGFFGSDIQWGTFFNGNNLEQSVFRMEGLYFSKLFELGRWKFRQFFNPEIVYGYNRMNYAKDKISLNGRYGIDGFDSYNLTGTKKVLLNFQTQSYAPGEWLGFRFSPFLSASLGWLGDQDQKFVTTDLYSKIGIGILINNDYLVFQNIQLSIALYPNMPGNGKNVIKTNKLRNNNFELMQFDNGRPSTVLFQ